MKPLSQAILFSMTGGLVMNACQQKKEVVTKRPNILIAIHDDQSFAHTGFAGCRFVNTPGFDRVARSGIYFNNCFAGSPGSAPSRSSLVTGRYHWQNEQSGQHASSWMKKYVPICDVLEAAGYLTGHTGKGVSPFQYARNENDSLWRKDDAAGKPYNKHGYERGTPSDLRTANGIGLVNYYANFCDFMQERKADQPFYFWYGSTEPHRAYEKDSWQRNGKSLDMVDVPDFLPDDPEIRGDLLDYAVEIEWAERHLVKMLHHLDSIGELDNTIVIVTADNGMPFPRAKANCFEYGVHVPMAISYPAAFPGNRQVIDPVSFADIVPTLLEMTGLKPDGMMPISGRSFVNILKSKESGVVDPSKKYIFAGRERHSSARWDNLGYPVRAIRTAENVLIWNMRPDLWPAGDPQAMNPETKELYPMYGVGKDGKHNSEHAFTDVDASPSKAFLAENHMNPDIRPYFDWAYEKRPEFELYDVVNDPYCLNNLSGKSEFASVETELKTVLLAELTKSGDPRVVGPDREIFETYIRYSPIRTFPKPDGAK